MSSAFEHQVLNSQLSDSISEAKTECCPMHGAARFDRYKVLVRKLAHHMSGTGDAITKEERRELIEIMSREGAPLTGYAVIGAAPAGNTNSVSLK